MAGKNFLEMSDEDFLASPEWAAGEAKAEPAPTTEEAPVVTEPVITEVTTPVTDTPVVGTPVTEKTDEEIQAELNTKEEGNLPSGSSEAAQETEEQKKAREETEAAAAKQAEEDAKLTPEELAAKKAAEEEANKPVDYETLYKGIVGQTFKAGKKTYEVKSPEEALKLMQMGAGFGRKMQEIQPHLKTLRLLENHNLLNVDQAELAFLIDLRNGNVDAIKKLVKDKNIDPLDFGNEEVHYRSNIPTVSDDEVVFTDTLKDIISQDKGLETVSTIEKSWDPESHTALMKNPEMLQIIHDQRTVGIYDRIVDEIDRQKLLGDIPQNTPFLQAYMHVGNHLRDTNGFADLVEKSKPASVVQTPVVQQPQILETRVEAPKPSISNSDKANAAAATRTAPTRKAPLVNPLAMSDEEFTKQFANF